MGRISNRLVLRWLKTVVVSDRGKGVREASGRDQEDERKRIAVDVSLQRQLTSKPGHCLVLRDESGGCPLTGQAVSGMEAT
ncbi:hypothetical protein GCM10027605_60930 [Micromonospora zhanjiangensis]